MWCVLQVIHWTTCQYRPCNLSQSRTTTGNTSTLLLFAQHIQHIMDVNDRPRCCLRARMWTLSGSVGIFYFWFYLNTLGNNKLDKINAFYSLINEHYDDNVSCDCWRHWLSLNTRKYGTDDNDEIATREAGFLPGWRWASSRAGKRLRHFFRF